jgi:CubicO group peptidase (beta-lactamase class C family)
MRSLFAASLLLCSTSLATAAEPAFLPRSSPEAQGIPSSAILAFVEEAERTIDALHSIMILRHGHVVAEGWWEPYRREDPHILFSLSKSFASTGIGLAIAEGRLSLDDTVLSFFPEDVPAEPSQNLQAMRVRDLLSMSTGHHADAIAGFPYKSSHLTKAFLALPVAHKPGTHFVYNTPASYMLSAIVQNVSGTTLLEYLGPRLFEPLGIQNPTWDASADGVSMGGFGLRVATEDIARFGQLYLQKGRWNGQQILPTAWAEAATARQVSNGSNPVSDWEQGYGYQFWRCRHDVYRGDGAFGQYCIVMPKHDAVIAITSGVGDMQAVLNLVWEHLLAGMQDEALPADERGHDRLQKKLTTLELSPQTGSATSPLANRISGRLYHLPEHEGLIEAVGLEVGEETVLVTRMEGEEHRLTCGDGEWRRGDHVPYRDRLSENAEEPVAVSGAWTSDTTYGVKVCLYETPFCATLGLEFAGDILLFNQEMNVAFGSAKRPQLVGRQEPRGRP